MSAVLESLEREESQVHGGAVGVSLLKKRMRVEGGGGYLVRDGVRVALEQLAEVADRAEAELTLEALCGGLLARLREKEGWRHFRSGRDREWMCVNGARVSGGDVGMVFGKSAL